ncbi:alpha/beta hydrolase [Shimazuella sp. AN120528]|uniref:alpha/beta fold hydrolase n=1 Tax=Shimazuella soli TaxID=1892854 RepID=UPI001F0E3E96|nr:alpha/beta hydrolase [Shimazuella soli]MCH5585238.1 alpha/beta hydrolase [Shimazuella soli]
MTTKTEFINSTIISNDGTVIGYKSIGQGPGVLIIHGALSDSNDFTSLAIELSSFFTVHIVDRRGRGISGPQGNNFSIQVECEDVKKILETTGANLIFGHSFGGLIALEVAKSFPTAKLALYEPGVVIMKENWDWLSEYESDMKKRDYRAAFASFVRGSAQSPLSRLPKWYAKFILRLVIRGEHWQKIYSLLEENLSEHKEVHRLAGTYRDYDNIKSDTLFMFGEKSPTSVKQMTETLNGTIQKTKVISFPELDHFGPNNKNKPVEISKHIANFFLQK